jgi:hypothetical protein
LTNYFIRDINNLDALLVRNQRRYFVTEVEDCVLKKEDFLRTRKPDGTLVLTHPSLSGTIELGPNESPIWLFPKFKEFSERHDVLLSPELAKLVKGLEEDLNEGMFGSDDELEDFTD